MSTEMSSPPSSSRASAYTWPVSPLLHHSVSSLPFPTCLPLYPLHPPPTKLAAMSHPAVFGMTCVFITTTSYLTESSKKIPATLVTLASLFRNPAAAVAAGVVAPLTEQMGVGWRFTDMELGCVRG